MRGQSSILNLLTLLILAATGLIVLVFAVIFLAPGIMPGFLRVPTQPVQVSIVTPLPTATKGSAYPTLPPEWTATPSPQPAPSNTATIEVIPTDTPTTPATDVPVVITPPATATVTRVVSITASANIRTGPSTAYSIVTRVSSSQTAPVVGRDSAGNWFAITFDGAPQGIGWVSTLAATYAGNISDLPVIQPSAPPPATSVPPTVTPAPTNTPGVGGANGIVTLLFQMIDTTGTTNQHMRFKFSVENTTNSLITYGILAAHTDVGVTADSWHDPLKPGKVLTWDDYIKFPNSGIYQVYLGICYGTHDACKSGGGWTQLSNSVTVTIN